MIPPQLGISLIVLLFTLVVFIYSAKWARRARAVAAPGWYVGLLLAGIAVAVGALGVVLAVVWW